MQHNPKNRPVYDKTIARLQPGDSLVVWSLDRAFRSAVDAINQADKLHDMKVDFVIADMGLDTSTAAGKLVYTVLAAMAEFERNNLIERTKQGLEAAKKRGVKLGRPYSLTRSQIKKAAEDIESGRETVTTCARLYGVDRSTMRRRLKTL